MSNHLAGEFIANWVIAIALALAAYMTVVTIYHHHYKRKEHKARLKMLIQYPSMRREGDDYHE